MKNNFYEVVFIDPVRDAKWDMFVENHPFGWFYHLSGWKKVLEKTFKHINGHYLAIVQNDVIKAALPLFEVKSWLTGNKLSSIPFATLNDPLVSTEYEMNILLEAAKKLLKDTKSSSLKITTHNYSFIKNSSFRECHTYKSHYLMLDKKPEDLMKTFDRTCVRQKISRAAKSNLTLKSDCNESDLKVFYKLYCITRKQHGLPPLPYLFMKNTWDEFYHTKNINLFLAEYKNQIIAGLIFFKYKDRVSVEFAASNTNFWNVSPNHYLFFEAIKYSYNEGFKIFDFGRTAVNNSGLMNFKSRWGTKVEDLPFYYNPKETFMENSQREQTIKYKLTNIICRKAPDFALPCIGKFIYRHI